MAGAALLACAVTQLAVPSAAQVTGQAHRTRGAAAVLDSWGNNVFGQLGNGTTQGVLVPTLIPLPAGVAAAALVPESGSTSAYLITAPGGRKRPLNFTKTGRLTWFADGPGPAVKIQGGGGGSDHSNCVSDTTDKTVDAFADPTHSGVFIDPTDSGSCAFEASFSYFTITVTGFDADAKRVNATGRIWLGQDAAGGDYYEKCALPLDHMTCREVNSLELEIVAQPEGRAHRGR
jgi:hypothetical protein